MFTWRKTLTLFLGVCLGCLLSAQAQIIWSPEIPISPVDTVPSYLSKPAQRSIAVGPDGRIHAVRDEGRSPYPDVSWGVWYRYSDDHGKTWSTDTCISSPILGLNATNQAPSLCVLQPSSVNVVWDACNAMLTFAGAAYCRSLDNGQTWSYPIGPPWEYWSVENSGWNSLCGDGDNYLLFYDEQWVERFSETRLLGLYSTNGGSNWRDPGWHGYSTRNKSDYALCTTCDSSDTGYLVWQSVDSLNQPIILFGRASPGESTLVPYPGAGGRGDAFIESDLAGKLSVAWSDSRDGNSEIYFKRSSDGGTTWSSDQRLTNSPGISEQPTLVVGNGGGKVYLVWGDSRDGNIEIYFKYSEDGGLTWGNDTRLTNNPANSGSPHIALSPDQGWLYVMWQDRRDGHPEVYFKRGEIQGLSVSDESPGKYGANRQRDVRAVPNPFISFTKVPGYERARIALYDVSGRKVGTYRGDRVGEGLAPGVYFLKPEDKAGKPVRIVKVR